MNPRLSGLWGHSDFMKLWTGQTVSQFGSTVTRTGLPLVALLFLGATPFQMGLLAAVASAPTIIVAPFAGLGVDRYRRRPIMIATDLLRAALLSAIPILALLGRLRLEHLFIVAPLVGILTVFFHVAYESYVPTLVSRETIIEANSKLEISGSLAEVTGPGVGGLLVQIASAPFAVVIDALTFLVSASLVALIRAPEPPPRPGMETDSDFRRQVTDGIRFIAGHPILRAFAGDSVTGSFFGNFFAALYDLYCIRELGMSPALLGLTIAAGGLGNLLGAAVTERTTRRFGIGATVMSTMAVGLPIGFLTPAAGGPLALATAMVVGAQLFGDGIGSVFQINALSLRQALTPAQLMGRVNGGMYLLSNGIGPLGALVGGALAEVIGVRGALFVAVAGVATGHLWLVFSPVRTLSGLLPNDRLNDAE